MARGAPVRQGCTPWVSAVAYRTDRRHVLVAGKVAPRCALYFICYPCPPCRHRPALRIRDALRKPMLEPCGTVLASEPAGTRWVPRKPSHDTRQINFRTFDLNLFRVFEDVMTARNVTRAAERVRGLVMRNHPRKAHRTSPRLACTMRLVIGTLM